MHALQYNHNLPGRIHEHWKCKPGDAKGCTSSETNGKQEVWDEFIAPFHALPSNKERKADDVSDTVNAGSSGPIQESLQAAGKVVVDQALADWVYKIGTPFNVSTTAESNCGCCT